MATRKTTAKPDSEIKDEQKSKQDIAPKPEKEIQNNPESITEGEIESVTLEQALKEEGEGRTPETIKNTGKKATGPSKMDKATKIMEEMWGDIQSGKVKRKDVIKRFMEEVPLSKAGSSTYYGTIKAKLSKSD